MLPTTVTHYFPWDESDDFAVCGAPLVSADQHRTAPSCPACRAILAQRDVDAELDYEEAVQARVRARVDARRTMSAVGATLFAFGVTLARTQGGRS